MKKRNLSIARILMIIGIIAVLLAVSAFIPDRSLPTLLKQNYIQAFRIPAGSMKPTLLVGDHILVDRRESARHPKRGDLIVFVYPRDPSKDFIKRVAAVSGDTVSIRDKELLINNKTEIEPCVIHMDPKTLSAGLGSRDNFGPVTVPEGSFFVLGDNRDESFDSRFFGFVEQTRIKGIAKWVYWSWDSESTAVRWDRIGLKLK